MSALTACRQPVAVFYDPSVSDFHPGYQRRSMSGFYSWYRRLILALQRTGYDVRENDFSFARKNPSQPIGVVGHRHILDNWNLPNPAVLGPSLYDHPRLNPDLMKDQRYRYYLVTAEWFRRLFTPFYGDSCVLWFAGIETDVWVPSQREKDIDFLIYDKVRWHRDRLERQLVDSVRNILQRRGYRVETIRYGNHSHSDYRGALSRSRAMVFLTEMETQGMAYQEALAMDVPVLAWDPGYWLDPQWRLYEGAPVPATSVPYFSASCGETFRAPGDFEDALDRLEDRLPTYRPREFVERELSLDRSAQLYMQYYTRAGEDA